MPMAIHSNPGADLYINDFKALREALNFAHGEKPESDQTAGENYLKALNNDLAKKLTQQ